MGAAQSADKLVTLKSGRKRVFRSKQEWVPIVAWLSLSSQ
jgi:hypothetical protein